MRNALCLVMVLVALVLMACDRDDTAPAPEPRPQVILMAGMTELQPVAAESLRDEPGLARFGLAGVDRAYEVTTPADTHFSFNLAALCPAGKGVAMVELNHVSDGGRDAESGLESLSVAGMEVRGNGLIRRVNSAEVRGTGACRLIVAGRIETEQVLLFRAGTEELGVIHVGVRVRIGSTSAINLPWRAAGQNRAGVSVTDVFSSPQPWGGLPALAASNGKINLLSYEYAGEPGTPLTPSVLERRRNWLQLDSSSMVVSGSTTACPTTDVGSTRDQEIAARGDLVAALYSSVGRRTLDISVDGGQTFAIRRDLGAVSVDPLPLHQIVTVAVGPDHRVACVYWDGGPLRSRLFLVEATPVSFDDSGRPQYYSFSTPSIIYTRGAAVVPLVMKAEYSEGGDLVIGYGYTVWVQITSPLANQEQTHYRVAVRPAGQTAFLDQRLDLYIGMTEVIPVVQPPPRSCPHVSLLGSGATMRIFYAYDKPDGVHLQYSDNGGSSFTPATVIAGATRTYLPKVFAHESDGKVRVDMLFLSPYASEPRYTGPGLEELHVFHWADFAPETPPVHDRLSRREITPLNAEHSRFRVRSLTNFGYSAAMDDGRVYVAVHETEFETGSLVTYVGAPAQTQLVPACPGTCGYLCAPDQRHRNQLRVLRLD